MRKAALWKADWFLGSVLALMLFMASGSDIVQGLERVAYDLGVRASNHAPSARIAVIAIDDQSIANIGRWPWSREIHAQLIAMLRQAGAKVVGYASFFFEPQVDPGLAYILKLTQLYQALPPPQQQALLPFSDVLGEAENALNNDRKLAAAITEAGNVALPMLFLIGEPRGNPDKPLPDYILKYQINKVLDRIGAQSNNVLPVPTLQVSAPIQEIAAGAAAIGHLNALHDVDGSTRTEPLVIRYYDQYFPSFSLMLAATSLNLSPRDIELGLGEGIKIGKLSIKTDPYLQMHSYFYKDRDGKPPFPVDSFYDVISGKIPVDKYRDKVVLIGATAAGVGTYQVTPISPAMPPVVTLAHAVSSILQQDFFTTPTWGFWVEKLVFALVALYIVLLLPRLNAGMGFAFSVAVLTLLIATHFFLMAAKLMWLQLMASAVLLVIGHMLLTTKRFLVTERGKVRADLESAESNRMLGLAFQGQGQLDMAFDKFKKVPLEDSVMDNMYNLALDFERKRQFNKAQTVYEYMSTHNPNFRDLNQKLDRARKMSETIILGGGSVRTNASTLLLDGVAVEKPMLGRYQVEKELGKGAMGVVYLGTDPKIGRVVAIKTMALAQEFEADELEEVKKRFFREAETAGRLNHPNIVTIYDAGEEHDLAYIAMEFLKGKDLVPQTKQGALLALPTTLSIIARVAEALSYAHAQNVVHRDIKPANIMYDPQTDSVKVTDFGIARITDSSKTKTGMVLGTPSYMSPEQLGGEKIEGQSDLFSLGVTLYQLSCGSLPFQGDSMTQLMFKIANEPPQNIRALNPALPQCVVEIINKALAKKLSERYQTGEQFAQALRACAALIPVVDVPL
ncbi:MAG: CHASE2 domain-containing serine/threonine-protein kinase [Burkholderiales bacterium]